MMGQGITEVERIVALESGMTEVRRDIHDIKFDVATMRSEVRDDIAILRTDLTKRPSWAVTTIISILLAASTALGGALLTLLANR